MHFSYLFGVIIGLGFGIWHFFTPSIYSWLSYIPDDYISLEASVIWINFLFSISLSGISLLLLMHRKYLFSLKKSAIFRDLYIFFGILWLGRITITIIYPFTGSYDWIFGIMISIFGLMFCALLLPFIFYLKNAK